MVFSKAIKNDFKMLGVFYVSIFALYMFNIVMERSFRTGARIMKQMSGNGDCANCGNNNIGTSQTKNKTVEMNQPISTQETAKSVEIPKPATVAHKPLAPRRGETHAAVKATVVPSEGRCDHLGSYPSIFDATQSTYNPQKPSERNDLHTKVDGGQIAPYNINANEDKAISGCLAHLSPNGAAKGVSNPEPVIG